MKEKAILMAGAITALTFALEDLTPTPVSAEGIQAATVCQKGDQVQGIDWIIQEAVIPQETSFEKSSVVVSKIR